MLKKAPTLAIVAVHTEEKEPPKVWKQKKNHKNPICSGAKDCKSCRSRKMLQNAYLDAKIGFDTDENEPSQG